jgi:transcriptional regulator with XRE-family HTH domain
MATVIRRRRLEKNLSETKFAQLVKVTPHVLSRIERGELDVDIATLFEIAATLETSCAELADQAQSLSQTKEFSQYRIRRRLTSLKQITNLQSQSQRLKAQLECINRQRRELIFKKESAGEVQDALWHAQREHSLLALEARLETVRRHQEEQERFLLRFLANRMRILESKQTS